MRIDTQFTPPKRKPGEGLLFYSMRCDKAKKGFEKTHKNFTGRTRDEKLKSLIPKFDD